MRGAHPVAVRDGGQALHVGADQTGDHRGLGLAQLGELGGHVRHRAVVLAQLPAGRDRGRVGSVTLGGSASASASARANGSSPASSSRSGSAPRARRLGGGELATGLGPPMLGDPAQRRGGDAVVLREAARAAAVSTNALAGRPRPRGRSGSPGPRPGDRRASRRGACGSRRGSGPAARRAGRRWPRPLEQQLGNPVTGTPIGGNRCRGGCGGGNLPPPTASTSTPFFTTPTLRNSAGGCKPGPGDP